MAPIDWKPVVSSNLEALAYDPENKCLRVRFKTKPARSNVEGSIATPIVSAHYLYSGVTQEVFDALMGSESIGKFFIAHVRDVYASVKIFDGAQDFVAEPCPTKEGSAT